MTQRFNLWRLPDEMLEETMIYMPWEQLKFLQAEDARYSSILDNFLFLQKWVSVRNNEELLMVIPQFKDNTTMLKLILARKKFEYL